MSITLGIAALIEECSHGCGLRPHRCRSNRIWQAENGPELESIFDFNSSLTWILALTVAVVSLLPSASIAEPVEAHYDTPMLNLGIGQVALDHNSEHATRYGIEYRARAYTRWKLVPGVGVAVDDSGASFVYMDVRHHFWLDDRWLIAPSFGVGFLDDSEKVQLGSEVEFRSGLELGYRFLGAYRLGIAYFHVSNGGLSERNPGAQVLQVSLYTPLRR